VIFTGAVRNVYDYLRASDVFVFPSRSEALGNSLLEAVACGLPSIGSNVGGIPESIENGGNGFLVPVGDVDGWISSLRLMYESEDMRDRFSAASRRVAEAKFNVATKVGELERVFGALQAR
jgi:glycosyltransferase involved in cell wall biosynthesis